MRITSINCKTRSLRFPALSTWGSARDQANLLSCRLLKLQSRITGGPLSVPKSFIFGERFITALPVRLLVIMVKGKVIRTNRLLASKAILLDCLYKWQPQNSPRIRPISLVCDESMKRYVFMTVLQPLDDDL